MTRRARAIALITDDKPIYPTSRMSSDPTPAGSTLDAHHSTRPSTEQAIKIGFRDFLSRVIEAQPDRRIHVVLDDAQLCRLITQDESLPAASDLTAHFTLNTEKWLSLVDVVGRTHEARRDSRRPPPRRAGTRIGRACPHHHLDGPTRHATGNAVTQGPAT